MNTQELLLKEYGPLMTLHHLAKVLDRAPQGLRVSLTNNSDISRAINDAKKKIGRRIYFKTEKIAQIIDND